MKYLRYLIFILLCGCSSTKEPWTGVRPQLDYVRSHCIQIANADNLTESWVDAVRTSIKVEDFPTLDGVPVDGMTSGHRGGNNFTVTLKATCPSDTYRHEAGEWHCLRRDLNDAERSAFGKRHKMPRWHGW